MQHGDTCYPNESKFKYITSRYGLVLSLKDIADIFHYPSLQAVRKAHTRGTLPVKLKTFPGRRGMFATAESVAEAIEKLGIEE